MTTEEKLKDLILSRYKSVREFSILIDMPYTTIDSIFRRGVGNSTVANVIKICKALRISADELAEGKIVSISSPIISDDGGEIRDILSDTKARLAYRNDLTIEGLPVDDDMIDALIQGIDVSLELAKRHNKNHNKNYNKNHNKNLN